MKKLLVSTVAAFTLITGASAIASVKNGPNEAMIQMFAMSQDMTEYQQELAVEVFRQVKSLADTVKAPKQDIKDYLGGLVEQDSIDVVQVMEQYKQWQQGVDEQFELSLIAVAKLHSDLTPEQRQQLVDSIKQLKSGKASFYQ